MSIADPTSLHAFLIRQKKFFVIPSLLYILEKKGLPGQKTTDNFRDVSETFILSEGCEISNNTHDTLIPIRKSPYMSMFI